MTGTGTGPGPAGVAGPAAPAPSAPVPAATAPRAVRTNEAGAGRGPRPPRADDSRGPRLGPTSSSRALATGAPQETPLAPPGRARPAVSRAQAYGDRYPPGRRPQPPAAGDRAVGGQSYGDRDRDRGRTPRPDRGAWPGQEQPAPWKPKAPPGVADRMGQCHPSWRLGPRGGRPVGVGDLDRGRPQQPAARPARPVLAKEPRPERTPWAGEQARARAVSCRRPLCSGRATGRRPAVKPAAAASGAAVGRSGAPPAGGDAGATKAGRRPGPPAARSLAVRLACARPRKKKPRRGGSRPSWRTRRGRTRPTATRTR